MTINATIKTKSEHIPVFSQARLTTAVYTSAGAVGQAAWDALGHGHPFASYDWYCYGESVLTQQQPIYIIVHQGQQPIARGTFWLIDYEPMLAEPGITKALMRRAIRRWPLLMCRTPLCSVSGLILPEQPALRAQALHLIQQRAAQVAEQHHASFVVFDYVTPEFDALPHTSQVELPDPGTILKLDHASFDDYIASLSRSTRRSYRRNMQSADELGIRFEIRPAFDDLERVLELVYAVHAHHGSHPEPHTRIALEKAQAIGGTWLLAWVQERLVGCGMLLQDNGAAGTVFLGLDYSVRYVYFQIFYGAIRAAIEQGAHTVYGGSGAYEFKQHLGFEVVTNNFTRVQPMQPMFKWITRTLLAN
jgi:predicted N-acyltransferase